jgi:short-subunit dehydrogenase
LTSAILCVQSLVAKLSDTAKIILIGSTSGLENNHSKEVAYQASKFGLRGLNNALRENFRKTKITSTIINLGDLSTHIPYELGEQAVSDQIGYNLIPVHDVEKVVNCLLELSPASYVKEIDMPGILDRVV